MIQPSRPPLDWLLIAFWTAALALAGVVWWALWQAAAWVLSLRDVRLLP
jgi:hypothetical protein